MQRKTSQVRVKGAPAADLALINARYALRPLQADEVAAFQAEVANALVDRDGEQFSEAVLEQFAASLPGKSLLSAHEWGPVGCGRFYEAHLDRTTGVARLMGSFYVLRLIDTDLVAKLEGGVAWAVSIGFYAPRREPVVDAAGRTIMTYLPGRDGEQAEALEASLVWLGAQYDAEVVAAKRAGRTAVIDQTQVLWKELHAIEHLLELCRYDAPGRPRRTDLSLVELSEKRLRLQRELGGR